ncbi:MAG: hypothetical protein DI586_11160 [Micavibrio aeruginosavorus]|uniref:Uncharacterized protein n=1 Tax=Micavibrio aeruginosavorus TaxID=349221 RepID=A0A2W5FB74_9BACT|nr:MAG: hypothetical protein DI586_11160 [Micavibrio aeruginosavorus]
MLEILGRRRLIVLVGLIVLAASSAYVLYEYLIPEKVKAESVLSSAKSALQQKRIEIQKLKEEYALLQTQLRDFKNIEAKGFFNDQGRVEAQENFEKLRTVSGVINAKYSIKTGQLKEDARANEAGYVILTSPIQVELDSIEDTDVYSFIKLVQERYPGKIDISKMSITKPDRLTSSKLREIYRGKPVPLIKSYLDIEWKTMASRQSLSPDTTQASEAATPQGVAPQ